MDISVIIPTHNRADALDKTLEYLARQNFSGEWETIIADNNSTEDISAVVARRQSKFPVAMRLVYEKISGAAATRNAGAKEAKGEYLLFLDNDILTEPDFLENHFVALKNNPNCWITGSLLNLPEQRKSTFGRYRQSLFSVPATDEPVREIKGVSAANLSMPRRHFELLGGFDTAFYSGEDFELEMRGRKQLGINALLVPSILVVHNDWAGWTFRDFCKRQRIYANSEYLFWKKYGDEHPRLQLVKENLPVDWKNDSARLKFRKLVKRGLANHAAQKVLINSSLLAEKFFPFKFILWRLYKLNLAGAIHQGFRQGMKIYGEK